MEWLWVIGIAIVFSGSALTIRRRLLFVSVESEGTGAPSAGVRETEISERHRVLRQLAALALGYSDPSTVGEIRQKVSEAEEVLQNEQGRISISTTELEVLENRLRELEEVERELETSQIDARRELEMLQSQEQEYSARNEQMRSQLETTFSELEYLITEFEDSKEACEQLNQAKKELSSSREKVLWYEEQIVKLNAKFIEMKSAYDALDIEYAQLYEKQSAV